MNDYIPGFILSFREGLEAFLILVLIFKFLEKTKNSHLYRSAVYGFLTSLIFSSLVGFLLFALHIELESTEKFSELWESIASLIAVGLVTTFIYWMTEHGNKIKEHIENKISVNLSKFGIFFISFILMAREGVEIAIFSFAGQYNYLSILVGILAALIISVCIYSALFKVSISLIFKITLVYLIIQAGYLLGYGLHEGLSALASLNFIQPSNILLIKLFDFSATIFNHKEGLIGIPLNLIFGWYSKPEWLQFVSQYIFTFSFLTYWYKKNRKSQT